MKKLTINILPAFQLKRKYRIVFMNEFNIKYDITSDSTIELVKQFYNIEKEELEDLLKRHNYKHWATMETTEKVKEDLEALILMKKLV